MRRLAALLLCTALLALPTLAEDIDPVEQCLSRMSLEQKVGQLFIFPPEQFEHLNPVFSLTQSTSDALAQYPVGGFCYFGANLKSTEQVAALLADTQALAKDAGLPGFFLAVDEEGGNVARCASRLGTTKFPPMMELASEGDPQLIYAAYQTIAKDISQFGFNVNFAPVADLPLAGLGSEIGDRAFSRDPTIAAEMLAQAVIATREQRVASVLKHFPGHGGVVGDSHNNSAILNRTMDQLREHELIPFIAGIGAGADMVMVSHATVRGIGDTLPASLSPTIGSLLRDELGYDGIIITDALRMQSVSNNYTSTQLAELCIAAGADILLLPQHATNTFSAMVELVKEGRITTERIDQSVRRVLRVKQRLGLL